MLYLSQTPCPSGALETSASHFHCHGQVLSTRERAFVKQNPESQAWDNWHTPHCESAHCSGDGTQMWMITSIKLSINGHKVWLFAPCRSVPLHCLLCHQHCLHTPSLTTAGVGLLPAALACRPLPSLPHGFGHAWLRAADWHSIQIWVSAWDKRNTWNDYPNSGVFEVPHIAQCFLVSNMEVRETVCDNWAWELDGWDLLVTVMRFIHSLIWQIFFRISQYVPGSILGIEDLTKDRLVKSLLSLEKAGKETGYILC